MVDLAAMRDAVAKNGVDPNLINPKCPTDLIVDHSLQIDFSKWYSLLGTQITNDNPIFIVPIRD